MYSIGKLCHEFNLSRSTLLYYDSIGLLHPTERTRANYRQYSERDKKRLRQIGAFREAGIPLKQIKDVLDADGSNESDILEIHLIDLNEKIRFLRLQQKLIVAMLNERNRSTPKAPLGKQDFVSILKSAGLDEGTLNRFHFQFEKDSPDAHQSFLEFLGVSDEEIRTIRQSSRHGEEREVFERT